MYILGLLQYCLCKTFYASRCRLAIHYGVAACRPTGIYIIPDTENFFCSHCMRDFHKPFEEIFQVFFSLSFFYPNSSWYTITATRYILFRYFLPTFSSLIIRVFLSPYTYIYDEMRCTGCTGFYVRKLRSIKIFS